MQTKEPLNTASLQRFIEQVKGADLGNQKEVRIDINTAKHITYTLATVLARLAGDYEALMAHNKQKEAGKEETVNVQVDGGKL